MIQSQSIDKYKQLFNFSFAHPIIQLKTNGDFKEPLSSRGSRLLSSDGDQKFNQKPNEQHSRRQRLRDLLYLFGDSVESLASSFRDEPGSNIQQGVGSSTAQDRWMGLSRYLDESQQEERLKPEPAEYAKSSTILDCPSGKLSIYWDVPGPVPPPSTASTSGTTRVLNSGSEDINGSHGPAPEWGIDLAFDGGTIHYGPWADRQRVFLQNMFFPRVYRTATPSLRLEPGRDRVPTKFKLFVELSSSTILRIPTREGSKDGRYRRMSSGEARPSGWIEVKVGPESTISYDMSMVAEKDGWKNRLNLDLKTPEIRSSVNHGLFWEADSQCIECDLSGPLKWNAKHTWTFDVLSRGLKLFILREHVTLLTDLVGDWASGPPTEYWTFTPFVYEIRLRFEDSFDVCANVNDQNIINNPSDFEDNTFLVLWGTGGLMGKVMLDFTRFRPEDTTVTFDVWLEGTGGQKRTLELGVKQPVWNTWNSFLKPETGMGLGSVDEFRLKGSYNFYSTPGPTFVDTLLLDIEGRGLKLTLFGFLIRYFLIIRENYFGENLHFRTLEEWQKQQEEGGALATSDDGGAVKNNDLDVILSVDAMDCCVVLPKNIYDAGDGLRLDVAMVGVDMRFTNYYMGLHPSPLPR